jgi:hypothetical protein
MARLQEGYAPNSTVKTLKSNFLTGQHEAWLVWRTDGNGNRVELLREETIKKRQRKRTAFREV